MTEPGIFDEKTPTPARRRLPRFGWLAVAVLGAGLAIPGNLGAQDGRSAEAKPTEYEVEAAYLSNFGRFIEWPAKAALAANEPFNVCVLGMDSFGSLLDGALKGEDIGGAPMAARRVASPEEAGNCRILFVSKSKDGQLKAILAALGTSSVLTVSDMPGFTKRGGMIQFVIDGDRVRFEINMAATQQSGLNLSSQLLKLAIAVRRAP